VIICYNKKKSSETGMHHLSSEHIHHTHIRYLEEHGAHPSTKRPSS